MRLPTVSAVPPSARDSPTLAVSSPTFPATAWATALPPSEVAACSS